VIRTRLKNGAKRSDFQEPTVKLPNRGDQPIEPLITLISVFAIFLPALMLPGPDFIAVVRSSMTKGTMAGILTTLGVTTGLGTYAILSLLGLSAILHDYQWLTWAVRILGGGYLIYLGIRLLFTQPDQLHIPLEAGKSAKNAYVFGLFVTLTNPKAIVLFTSVFATAVTEATPLWLMVAMILLVILSSLIWYFTVSLFMSSASVIARFSNARHWIERTAGVCFIAIGGRVISDSRYPLAL
jgi:threonine efflux protein